MEFHNFNPNINIFFKESFKKLQTVSIQSVNTILTTAVTLNQTLHTPPPQPTQPILDELHKDWEVIPKSKTDQRTSINIPQNPKETKKDDPLPSILTNLSPFFGFLPEKMQHVWSLYLSLKEIVRLMQVSRWMRLYFSSDTIWAGLFNEYYSKIRMDDIFNFVTETESKCGQSYMNRFKNEYLRDLPLEQGLKCARCLRFYNQIDNNETSCVYHRGNLLVQELEGSYACCSNISKNGIEAGNIFYLVGKVPLQEVFQIASFKLWNLWLTEEDISKQLHRFKSSKTTMGQIPDGTSIYYINEHFKPKLDELHQVSIMLLFMMDDEKSLESLIQIHAKWEQSLGLCLNTNIPLLVGVRYHDAAGINLNFPQSINKVMHLWNCNRFMVINIGDGNSVKIAFHYLANNFISQLHRGCSVGPHVSEIPVSDSIKKILTVVGFQ